MKTTIVYLASIVNTKFGYSPATVPLEIGYIKAYAMSQLAGEKIDIQLFKTFESLYEAIKIKQPDILGCSWYGWSLMLTTNALTYIKSKFPNVITVVGGANVPEKRDDCLRDLKDFSCIDMMISNEGEIPFVNLLKVFIAGGKEAVFKNAIDGVCYLSESGDSLVMGNPVPLAEDVNIFPSPYLKGYLDQFLKGELMPILQTVRGCPFHCSFCVAAKDSWNKIRTFDVERVKEEINYLEANAESKTIRFTDENFGILPRDREIAKFIADKRAKTGYPSALRVYTNKNVNDNIKEIILLLRDLIPVNISCQTLTEEVLKNIGRQNISLKQFRDVVNWAHKNNLNVTTEIIFGLPGETSESFMNVINQFVDLRLDSIGIGTLMMLKETKINHPEEINKYGYKVLYSVAERGYTKSGNFESVEIDAWGVESNRFSFSEYLRMKLFIMIYHLFMFWGYFKEMVYIWDNQGVKIADVISEFLDQPQEYPFFSQQTGRLKKCLEDNLFKTKEEVRDVFSRQFSADNGGGQYIGFMSPFSLSKIIKGDMIYSLNQEKMIEEVIKASIRVFDRNGKGNRTEFLEEMRFAKALIKNIIIPFWEMPQEEVVVYSPYDLIAWRNQSYLGTLSQFILPIPVKYKFNVRSLSQYSNFIREYSCKPFYLQSEFFFRTFRSNNVRRFISTSTSEGNIE